MNRKQIKDANGKVIGIMEKIDGNWQVVSESGESSLPEFTSINSASIIKYIEENKNNSSFLEWLSSLNTTFGGLLISKKSMSAKIKLYQVTSEDMNKLFKKYKKYTLSAIDRSLFDITIIL